MTASANCNASNWLMSHYIVPNEKSTQPLQCGLFSKFSDHLLLMTLMVVVTIFAA